MNGLKHILAATDLSAASMPAVARGFLLAAASGARYTLLHALNLEGMALLRGLLGDRSATVSARMVEDAQQQLDALAREPAHSRGVAARTRVEEGLAGTVVPARAEAEGADLVLVGAHGSGFLDRKSVV